MAETEEIEFFDYLLVLWKRKGLILVGTILTALAVAAYVYNAPPVFETTLNLEIGRIWNQPIESLQFTSARITSEPFLSRIAEKLSWLREQGTSPRDMILGKMVDITTLESAGLISLKVRSDKPEHALEIANTIASMISEEHQQLFEAKLKEQISYQKKLETKIDGIERENSLLGQMLEKYRGSSDMNPLFVLMVQAQIVEKETGVIGYGRELHDVLVNNNSRIQTTPTRVVDPPLLPQRQESRGIARSAIMGAVLGFFAFALAGFFLEFLDNRSAIKRRQHGG